MARVVIDKSSDELTQIVFFCIHGALYYPAKDHPKVQSYVLVSFLPANRFRWCARQCKPRALRTPLSPRCHQAFRSMDRFAPVITRMMHCLPGVFGGVPGSAVHARPEPATRPS